MPETARPTPPPGMGMRGLQDWIRSHRNVEACQRQLEIPKDKRPKIVSIDTTHPDGDVGATCKNRNVGSNKVFVIGASQCLGLRGQHPPPHGDAGATSKNRNVGSNKIYIPGVSECLRLRGQHPPPAWGCGGYEPTPLQHPQTGVRITIKAMNKRLMTRVLTPSSF